MNEFLKMFGKSLGPTGGAEDVLTSTMELQKRCAHHFVEQLGVRALLRNRYRELDPQEAARFPPGTMPHVSRLLPELPFWFEAIYVPKPINPTIGSFLAGGKQTLPVENFLLQREEHLAKSCDPEERPFCGLFVIPKRRYFMAAFLLGDLPPVRQHSRYPSELAVTTGDNTYVFTSTAAMLRLLKKELKL